MTIEPGKKLAGAYEVSYLLGRGSGSRVYRARQLGTGDNVAVKVLQLDPGLGAADRERRIARFKREMRICARLEHPDVVRLLDHGQDGEVLFSVFELVSGQTLSQVLTKEGALTIDATLSLMRQLLEVLVHAHGLGVIHRDLKPSNLMVLGEGPRARIKVLDFGIGALSGGRHDGAAGSLTRLTLSHEMVGTPAYAAPEQLRGEAPTAKTDLYAWGLVTLECLTGRAVMRGASIGAIFQEQLSAEPVALPTGLRAHPLGALLQWALGKDSARRAGSARDILEQLDALAEDSRSGLVDASGYLREASSQRAFVEAPPTATFLVGSDAGAREERRQVTAVCCRLSWRVPPDVDAAQLDAYRGDVFALCHATVAEFDGTLVGAFGDLALYYFGIPNARDVDARMAARSALELAARVRSRRAAFVAQSGVSVVLETAVHSGMITAKDSSTGSAFAHGLVAAVAAALVEQPRGVVEPTITVSEAFRRLTARHYEYSDRETRVTLAGSDVPLVTYQLLGESLGVAFAQEVAPMVGRDAPLQALAKAHLESQRTGRVALVSGEAGIGKSRLLCELRRQRDEATGGVLSLRFLPEMQHVPLGALFELVTAELGLSQRSSSDDVAAALREFAVDLERAVPLLCEWTSARLEAPWLPLPFSPEKQRALLVRLLVDLVFELLRRRSGYLQVEDLHWADQSTLDWLGLLFGAIVERGGFAVMTARPDFIPPWDVPDLLVFEMSPLSPDEVAEMVASLPTGHGMSSQVIEQIVARADGVPLFVEELAAVFADHLEDAPTRDALPEVPATLRDLLMSRLDALGPAKATAQVAAAIGREFDQDLLRASVPGKDEATLLADLAQLVSYRLVITRRAVGYQRYSFRHALVRDAAYESMLPPHREIVHARVADALLHEFPERVEKRPDLVALQLELAGLAFQAQSYWLSAGRLALREVAYDEARAYLQRGLDVLGQCPAGVARTDAELDLLGAMSAAHIAKLGYGAPQLGQLMAQVEALTEGGTASSGHALPLLWGRYLYHAVQPDHRRSLLIANSMLERSAQTGDRAFSLQGHSAAIRNHFWRGEFVEALAHFDALSSLGDPELIRSLRPITGEDPHWAGAGFSALCLLITGRTAEGMGLTAQVAQSAHDTGLPGLAQASWTGFAHSHLLRGLADPTGSDLERAVDFGRRAREGAAELGFPFWQAYGGLMEAAAMICGGQLEGIVQMEAMMAMFAGAGARVGLGWNLDTLAYGYMQAGDLEKAASMLARSRDHAQQSGEDFYSSINARFEGRLAMLRSGGGDTAEVRLRESVAIASRQGARLFEAQSMVQLLELFERQGRPNADLEALCASASWQNSHSQDLAAVPSLARLFRSACQPIERRGGTRTEAEVGLES